MKRKVFFLGLVVLLLMASVISVFAQQGDSITVNPYSGSYTKTQSIADGLIKTKNTPEAKGYMTGYEGLWRDEIQVQGKTRSYIAYYPKDIVQGDNSLFLAVPSGVNTANFLRYSGWMKAADDHHFILFALEPDQNTNRWDLATDDFYINKTYSYIRLKPYFNMIQGNWYFVGYGDGGTLIQRFVMKSPRVAAGLAVFDGDVDVNWMTANGKLSAISATPSREWTEANPNGDLIQSNIRREVGKIRSKAEVEVPVWILTSHSLFNTPSDNTPTSKIIQYWKNANRANASVRYSTRYGNEVYFQSRAQNDLGLNTQNSGRVCVTKLNPGLGYYVNKSLTSAVASFLNETRRFGTGLYYNALRPAIDPENDLGITMHRAEINGRYLTWYEYVPTTYDGSKNVPLLFAYHGGGQTGRIYIGYTEWYKVAEDRGFIVVFPGGDNTTSMTGGHSQLEPFTRYIYSDIQSRHKIDTTRVYATGQSMGSNAALDAAKYMSDIFAATASTSFFNDTNITVQHKVAVRVICGENESYVEDYNKAVATATSYLPFWIGRNLGVDATTAMGMATNPGQYARTYNSGLHHFVEWQDQDGAPWVSFGFTEMREHNYIVEENLFMWDDFLSKWTKGSDGEPVYKDQNKDAFDAILYSVITGEKLSDVFPY